VPSPRGYATIVDPDAPLWEQDTIGCGHCGKVIFLTPGSGGTQYRILHHNPRTTASHWTDEPGAFCRCCMRAVCLRCHDRGTCTPLEMMLEQMETGRPRALRSARG